jgi:hypothetical protein
LAIQSSVVLKLLDPILSAAELTFLVESCQFPLAPTLSLRCVLILRQAEPELPENWQRGL